MTAAAMATQNNIKQFNILGALYIKQMFNNDVKVF